MKREINIADRTFESSFWGHSIREHDEEIILNLEVGAVSSQK
jgi:hypothetical protein